MFEVPETRRRERSDSAFTLSHRRGRLRASSGRRLQATQRGDVPPVRFRTLDFLDKGHRTTLSSVSVLFQPPTVRRRAEDQGHAHRITTSSRAPGRRRRRHVAVSRVRADGVLMLDPTAPSPPKLHCSTCSVLVRLPRDVRRARVSADAECAACGSKCLDVEYFAGKRRLACLACEDTLRESARVARSPASAPGGRGGRGGRGRRDARR